jgi:uncharacterized NAD(P)/FAD-binding protein YdhS
VVVVEPAARLGEGVAYRTTSASHILNVRADGMSAFPDRPTDFTRWACGTGLDVDGSEFLPRMLFARYLRDALAGVSEGTVRHLRDHVGGLAAEGSEPRLTLADGTRIAAHDVVLATGNGLAPLGWTARRRVIRDPWAPGALDEVGQEARVAIVGSGLSAVDVVLSLDDREHRGPVTMVSSHGLLPEAHAPRVLNGRRAAFEPGTAWTAHGLVRALRDDASHADDWRQTVDAVRPVTVAIWRGLPVPEQRRAMRHAFRRWEVRRHRMAPDVAALVDRWRSDGRLRVVRGRVLAVDDAGDGLVMSVGSAGSIVDLSMDAVIACVGPSADPLHDPLLRDAIRGGLVVRHQLGLGLDVDELGRARRPDGTVHPHLWTVGSLRKGAEWEATAVPELRMHARDIAAALIPVA